MAKKSTFEARLAGLRALDPTAPASLEVLRAALADTWLLAAAAADLARTTISPPTHNFINPNNLHPSLNPFVIKKLPTLARPRLIPTL